MSILELDEKGRLTLPKKVRESLNIKDKVLVVNAGDHLKVIPLPSNPFQVLHGALKIGKPFETLRGQAELAAEEETRRERG